MNQIFFGIAILLAALPPHDPTVRIHDFAGKLTHEQSEALEQLCRAVETETTAQVAVVTVRTLEGKTIETYANELFNAWQIGQRDVNNGVLLLVAPTERDVRIEVGRGLEPLLTDALCGEILDDYVVPAFKRNDLQAGIRAGTEQIVAVLRRYPEAARGVPGSAPFLVRTKRRDALMGIAAFAAVVVAALVIGWYAARRQAFSKTVFYSLAAVVVLVGGVALALTLRAPNKTEMLMWFGGTGTVAAGASAWNVKRYRRYGPRSCAKCGTRLELLGETDDDEKLSEVQRLEETLGSVDYDVWYCPACLQSETEAYTAFFSAYKECPKCAARTLQEGPQQVLTHATSWSTGMAKVEGNCMSCKHHTERFVTLPVISSSSSSGGSSFSSGGGGGGGSSFGGGSSGGGGASRSW